MADINILIKAKDLASRPIKGVKKELGGLNKGVDRLGRGSRAALGNIEKGIALGAGAAVAGIGYAVKAAVDFEDAFAGVKKTVDETDLTKAGLSFQSLSDDIRKMSREMPLAVDQIAAIAEQAGALGVKAPDIAEFTRVAALLGVTTNVSAEDAATALGQLGNVMGLTSKDYARFGATLVDLGNKGASTEADILEIARRAGGAAHTFGVAKSATLGWASAFANLGMQPELAGTSLQTFITKTASAVSTGGEKLDALAKVAGTTAKNFKKAFQKDASGALEQFIKGLGKLSPEKRLQVVQGVFGKTSGLTRALLGLADSYERNLAPSIDTASQAWEQNTALTAEAEKRFETTKSKLQVLKNNLHDAAITIGSELLPEFASLAKEGTDWLQGHQPEIKAFAKDLANGLREAVKWARSLDWKAITGTLKAGAGVAKGIVDAFLNAPPWVQGFLTTGFVANKFTGGLLGDVVGDVMKGAIKGVLGINAGVVNINAASVNGGGGLPGVPGGGKGMLGWGGKLGSILGNPLVRGATILGGGALMANSNGADGNLGGIAGNIGGGAIAGSSFGPLGALAGGLIGAVKSVADDQSAAASRQATGVRQQAQAWIQGGPGIDALKAGLAATEQGIKDIESNPLAVMLHGDALATLKAQRDDISAALAEAQKTSHAGYVTAQAAQTMKTTEQQSLVSFREGERASRESVSVARRTAQATGDLSIEQRDAKAKITAATRSVALAVDRKRMSVKVNVTNSVKTVVSYRDYKVYSAKTSHVAF